MTTCPLEDILVVASVDMARFLTVILPVRLYHTNNVPAKEAVCENGWTVSPFDSLVLSNPLAASFRVHTAL